MSQEEIGRRWLSVDGRISHVRRLAQNPPVAGWDGQTAWTVHDGPSGQALLESAVIECPSCQERAFWRAGTLRCDRCGIEDMRG